MCIGVTAWVVLKPESNLAWRMFGSMPRPSSQLAELLHYPDAAWLQHLNCYMLLMKTMYTVLEHKPNCDLIFC